MDFKEVGEHLEVQNEEEIETKDYKLPFPLEGSTRLWEINVLCRIMQGMQGAPLCYEIGVIQKRWPHSLTELINDKDHIRCYSVQDGGSPARYLVQEMQIFGGVHPDSINRIGYTAIDRKLKTSENYLFMDNGIFSYC